MAACATHPTRPATHRCDGCGKLLCEAACVKPSHRLLLCALCGELAVPLGAPAGARVTASSTELRRSRARTAPYGLGAAFLYPFRGKGAGVFWVYFVLVSIFTVIPYYVPFSGCFLFIPSAIVGLLVPRLLFTVVRTTAEGENELPDWPDFDFWERLLDALMMAAIVLVAAVPGIALFVASDCNVLSLLGEAAGRSCWPPLVAAFVLGVALWIPTLGATSVFDSFWLLPRLDLHVRALLANPAEALIMTVVLAVLLVASYFLRFAVLVVPAVGAVLSVFIGIYATFTGAHLVGVYFRRHFDRLERLYVG